MMDSINNILKDLVHSRDESTGGHSERTAGYVKTLINAMLDKNVYAEELRQLDIESVFLAAQLHDLGKIAIPDSVLLKEGELTGEELEVFKSHAAAGERIISEIAAQTKELALFDYAKVITACHHERWDGAGYPLGLKGEEIPLLARIAAVADVYDYINDVALMRAESGKAFDPVILDVFLSSSNLR